MGDRISISFRKTLGENWVEESPVLFSHWDGESLITEVYGYLDMLTEKRNNGGYPLDRLEPGTVMVDFIRHLTKDAERVKSNYYLGKTQNDGDNSDNGHRVIDLDKWEKK